MPTVNDAKSMARAMEGALRAKNITLSHGECLDIVAKQLGLKDWNVLSAQAKRYEASSRRRASHLKSWMFMATHPDAYDHGADDDPRVPNGGAALIHLDPVLGASRYPDHSRAFGNYTQAVSAVPFRGKRIEIGAELRSRDVTHGATIWAMVNGLPGQTLGFDNLKDVSEGWLFGTVPWIERNVVLDVPADAWVLNYGFFLKGKGSLWAADFHIGEASAAAELTSTASRRWSGDPSWLSPSNLHFSDVIDYPASIS